MVCVNFKMLKNVVKGLDDQINMSQATSLFFFPYCYGFPYFSIAFSFHPRQYLPHQKEKNDTISINNVNQEYFTLVSYLLFILIVCFRP